MAHKSENFIAIQTKNLEKLPIGPQRWVKKYFKEKDIFGKPCYVAFSGGLAEYLRNNPNPQGVAVNTIDWKIYVEGLTERTWLTQWFTKQPYVFSFSNSWNDGNSESALED